MPDVQLPTPGGAEFTFGNCTWDLRLGSVIYKVIADAAHTGDLQVNKSTNGGASWIAVGPDPNDSPVIPRPGNPCFLVDDKIYVLGFVRRDRPYPEIDGLGFAVFDTVTETWDKFPAFSSIGMPASGLSYDGDEQVAAAVRDSNGRVLAVFAFAEDTIGLNHWGRVYWAEWDGTDWSTATMVPGQSGIERNFMPSFVLQSASEATRMHVFLESYDRTHLAAETVRYLHHVSLADDGTFGTFTDISSDLSLWVSDGSGHIEGHASFTPLAYLDKNGVGRIGMPFIGGGSDGIDYGIPDGGLTPAMENYVAVAVDAADPTWSVVLFDSTTQCNSFEFTAENLMTLAYIDKKLNVLWCAATEYGEGGSDASGDISAIAGNIMRAISPDEGATWGTPTAERVFSAPFMPCGVLAKFVATTLEYSYYLLDTSLFSLLGSAYHYYVANPPKRWLPQFIKPLR